MYKCKWLEEVKKQLFFCCLAYVIHCCFIDVLPYKKVCICINKLMIWIQLPSVCRLLKKWCRYVCVGLVVHLCVSSIFKHDVLENSSPLLETLGHWINSWLFVVMKYYMNMFVFIYIYISIYTQYVSQYCIIFEYCTYLRWWTKIDLLYTDILSTTKSSLECM